MCKGGENLDKKLLEMVYGKYYKELYIYVYSLCGQRAMTEDILQETFLKAFTALKDSHTNMRAWLYMVARNLCFNWMKRESRVALTGDVERKERYSREQEDIAETLVRDEQREKLWKALAALPDIKREVLILQYFGEFSQKEIAAMLKLTPGNVRILAHRAKKELKMQMEVDEHDIP